MDKVKFTEMKYGTKEDYDLLSKYEEGFVEGLADRILQFLKNLDGSLDGYQITRLETACKLHQELQKMEQMKR